MGNKGPQEKKWKKNYEKECIKNYGKQNEKAKRLSKHKNKDHKITIKCIND